MRKNIMLVLAFLGLAVSAGAEVNFDKGVDVKSFVKEASSVNKDYYPTPGYQYHSYFTKDCRSMSFGPSASSLISDRVYLDSTEYVRECHMQNVQVCHTVYEQHCHTVMVPGPNNTQVAQQQCTSVPKQQCHMEQQQQCYDRPGQTFHSTAQLNIAPRKLYPWEKESFNVCMEGNRVDVEPSATPYSYDIDREGLYDLTFRLTPGYRVATPPDENGLSYTAFSFKDGKFTLNVADNWAAEYAGEKVVIKVELKKDGFLFFDSSKGEKTFTFDTAAGYDLVFAENDLTKTKAFQEDEDYRGPSKYFVKWGFQRIGKVSTDKYVKKDQTPKITK